MACTSLSRMPAGLLEERWAEGAGTWGRRPGLYHYIVQPPLSFRPPSPFLPAPSPLPSPLPPSLTPHTPV